MNFHSWERAPNPPYFMKTFLYYLPLIFQILSNSSPLSSLPPTSTPTALFLVLFLWLNGWLRTFDVLFYLILLILLMDLHIYGIGTLVAEGSRCVFYVIWGQVYWGLRHNVMFCWCFDLISRKSKHTNTHTSIPIQIYIESTCYMPISVLHWINNDLISKIYFPQHVFFFQKLFTCRSQIFVD